MKTNIVAFLSKENVDVTSLLDPKKSSKQFELGHENSKHLLCLDTKLGMPKWSKLFADFEIEDKYFSQKTVKGALLVRLGSRYVVFTFGHGRSLLNHELFEKGFGLRVAMNIGDPNQIKSIDKATLEKVARNTRSQVSTNSGVEDFDFEFDHEILKSLTAIVDRDDDELEMVSGNDSVSLYTELEFDKFEEIGERLIQAYNSKEFKNRYPWADFIGIETNPEIKMKLDQLLADKFETKDLVDIWISTPKIVEYQNFAGFVYNLNTKKGSGLCYHPELDLAAFLSEAPFRHPISPLVLKAKKIYLYNTSDIEVESWKFYDTINAELELNEVNYILNDGRWYRIKDTFKETVEEYYENMPLSSIDFPLYKDQSEGDYLRRIADKEKFALLDQKWVQSQDVKQNFEFVGDQFAYEARKIHYSKSNKKPVYGNATKEEVADLSDEGIEVTSIPWIKEDN